MKYAIALLTLALALTGHSALVGAVRVNSDTTSTNTRPSAVTVTLNTNMNGGVFNATNAVNVGVGGTAPGIITILSTNGTYSGVITMTNTGSMMFTNSGPFDDTGIGAFMFISTNLGTSDLAQFWNPDFATDHPTFSLQRSGTYLGRKLYVEDSWESEFFTRIQPGTDLLIHSGPNTNTITLDGGGGSPSMTMVHEGTNTFFVATDSGYLGGGTLFLSDDGTYKAAGNASVNPTDLYMPFNNAGTFDDSPLWVGTNSWYAQFGTNLSLSFYTNGSIFDQRGFEFWGQTDGANYISHRDTSLGDYNAFNLWADVTDGTDTGYFNANGTKTFASAKVQSTVAGVITSATMDSTSAFTSFRNGVTGLFAHDQLTLYDSQVSLKPTIAAGNTPAFEFSTTQSWVGTNIMRVRNVTTNVFVVRGNSGYAGGGTKVLTDDGTYKSVSGIGSNPGQIGAACSDETTALTTGTNKVRFRMPYAMTLTAVRASLTTAQTGGSIITIDINENGTSILSTKITIDDNETTSTTAAIPPVISDSALGDDSIITVDIDQVGTSPAGLKVWLLGTY